MKRKLRFILIALLAAIFVGSSIRVVYQTIQYKQGDETYSEAEDLVQLPDFSKLPVPELPSDASTSQPSSGDTSSGDTSSGAERPVYVDPYADALRSMDFTALRKVNSDILGWILIPNTTLSYPLVQGEDNDYYLNHTWKKTRNSVGAIFMEYHNSSDLRDFNTIIYGHRMNNRSMFGTLSDYKNHSYWSKHPYLYLSDDNGSHKYEIFAAYEVSVTGTTYQLGFSNDASKQSFIDYCLEQSVIDTGVVPTVYDRIITLSTCTGNGHATRWVIQGVLKGEAPADPAPPAVPDSSSGSASSSSSASSSDSVSGSSQHTVPPVEPEPPISQDIRTQSSDTDT